jgi:hypothetical protein
MSPAPRNDAAAGREPAEHALLVEELERRILEIESAEDAVVGRFTAWDWLICVGGAVVAPALAMWWFAGE